VAFPCVTTRRGSGCPGEEKGKKGGEAKRRPESFGFDERKGEPARSAGHDLLVTILEGARSRRKAKRKEEKKRARMEQGCSSPQDSRSRVMTGIEKGKKGGKGSSGHIGLQTRPAAVLRGIWLNPRPETAGKEEKRRRGRGNQGVRRLPTPPTLFHYFPVLLDRAKPRPSRHMEQKKGKGKRRESKPARLRVLDRADFDSHATNGPRGERKKIRRSGRGREDSCQDHLQVQIKKKGREKGGGLCRISSRCAAGGALGKTKKGKKEEKPSRRSLLENPPPLPSSASRDAKVSLAYDFETRGVDTKTATKRKKRKGGVTT